MYYFRKFNKCLPQHAFQEGIVSSPTDIEWEDTTHVGTWGMWLPLSLATQLLTI